MRERERRRTESIYKYTTTIYDIILLCIILNSIALNYAFISLLPAPYRETKKKIISNNNNNKIARAEY